DDGSRDATAKQAEDAGAEVISETRTQGKGAALQRAWRHACARGFTWALTLDGDGQHCAQDIPSFFECAEKTSAALVVGNRMSHASEMPWIRRLTNRWLSARVSILA